jgi:hypothetical protein
VDDVAWEKHKKANALPGAGAFHTAEQLTPRITELRGAFTSRSFFYGDPGLERGSNCRTKARSPTLVRLALPRPPNLDLQY